MSRSVTVRSSSSPKRLTAVVECLGGLVVFEEARSVHDGDHRVEARHFAQADAVSSSKVKVCATGMGSEIPVDSMSR